MSEDSMRQEIVMMQQRPVWKSLQSVPYAAALSMILAAGLISGGVADDAPTEAGDVGLAGIFPDEVPNGLTVDDFAALDGAWADWSAETATLVENFYASFGSLDEQKEKLAVLRAKDRVMERALDDPRYRSLFAPLTTLHGRLHRRLDLAEAILETLELDPATAKQQRIAAAADDLAAATSALESAMKRIPNGQAWVDFVSAGELKAEAEAGTATAVSEAVSRKLALAINSEDETLKAFAGRPVFQGLNEAVTGYVSAVNAPVEDVTPALREQASTLIASLEEYEGDPTAAAAATVREAYAEIRRIAPDGGAILTKALRAHVFNYNMRVLASESFLSRLIADNRRDSGGVRDYILGASVSGSQTTDSTIGLDLRPSNDTIRFAITLSGVSRSNTAGRTEQATIFTSGYHTFMASKQVDFDGDRFTTAPGTISVNANNTTTGADVDMLLFRGLGQRIAMQEAAKKRPQSEAIAADRVRNRVLPQFNSEVNKSFSEATAKIESDVNAPLKELGLFPDARSYQSTNSHAKINTRLMDAAELGGSDPAMAVVPQGGATLMLHESVLNNAADRLDFAGKEMTDQQVRDRLEEVLKTAFRRDIDIPDKDEPGTTDDDVPNVFVFDQNDPIRFRVSDDTVFLILRAGFKRQGSEDPPIPAKEITVPLHFTIDGGEVLITRDNVEVSMVERVGIAEHIGQAGVIRKKIESGLPERRLDGVVEIEASSGRKIKARVREVIALDGWVTINVQ